ncbi:hypothetical protein PRIPAC_80637 [Pristionchus pacificus]|uniref:Uncharacterized protein n=1 Tax=Pristionchus pacificus TaxID=54126 RepID=A0A2A6C2D7_PRIPA|nr:hypothetical protein PRIPAC_80637 [Pristionchus pacificus]|eukprot:PDM72191.1 hypothetical protein PRIPAC_38625 [Pristionchus pacificus]
MSSNATLLRFALNIDRDFLFEFWDYVRIILPIFNSFTLHPLMLLLLKDSKTMASDVRLGYFLTEVALIAYDWVFNFFFRMYPMTPYSGFYCGGPACKFIENRKMTAVLMLILIFTMVANVFGFVMFAVESDDAAIIRELTNAKVKIESQDPELRWLTERGGRVFIFGTYGDTQHFRYGFYYLYSVDLTIMYAELYILGASLLSNVPMPLLVTIDAVINLRSMKKVVVSSRTLKITHQLLSLFISQLNAALVSMILPLSLLFFPMMVDIHQFYELGIFILRLSVTGVQRLQYNGVLRAIEK